jgi:hypothetical protein
MNRLLLCATLLSCLTTACKQKEKVSQTGLEGVYQLQKQVLSGGKKDSTIKRDQVKIYTDRHFLYASIVPDSSVGFGVGSYTLDSSGKKIVEKSMYTSRALDSSLTYNLKITKRDSGYTQVIPDYTSAQGVKYVLTEDYKKFPPGDTTKLDGLWKMERTFTVKGKDTVLSRVKQYKIYWSGHFTFIHRFPLDSTEKKFRNGFGTGIFTLRNDTLREVEQNSNYSLIRGHKFAIKISFNGPDEYTQIINSATNGQSVEIYRRVK